MRKIPDVACLTPMGIFFLFLQRINVKTYFYSKTIRPIELKFHEKILMGRGKEIKTNGFSHMTKMAATLYLVKPFKYFLLYTQKADYLGTWYVAFGMWGLPRVSI